MPLSVLSYCAVDISQVVYADSTIVVFRNGATVEIDENVFRDLCEAVADNEPPPWCRN